MLYLTIVSIYFLISCASDLVYFARTLYLEGRDCCSVVTWGIWFAIILHLIASFALVKRSRIGVYFASVLVAEAIVDSNVWHYYGYLQATLMPLQQPVVLFLQTYFYFLASIAMAPLLFLGWKKNVLR